MELNIPSSGTVSKESPAVVQMHEDTKVPISEIKAKLHNKIMELNQKRLQNPSEVPYGSTVDDLKEQAYKDVNDELLKPEEAPEPEADEFQDIFGDEYPGSEAFSAPGEDTGAGFDDFGAMGGDFGGDFGGIDNAAMGFGDEDMDTLNATADNAFDDFTADDSAETASDVNNMSSDEPGQVESEPAPPEEPESEEA